ncbi:c-type cytochrome [Luteimonas sp. SJ-92]|uniref:C-type cytochrome n=1 Tax=Luteimonas salinisoli TaxID=2752307 RepID=A0A853JF97_9GAMM|nr:c-type cytochrome [Luteimonas salinisoli]
MRHARAYGIAGLTALGVVAAVAFAQSTTVPLPEEAPIEAAPLGETAVADLAEADWGDPQNGATLAATCAACHGLDGKATVREVYPGIAGQSERYIARQLALFKSGERVSPIMQPFAAPLSAQDMRDLGAHYAMQQAGAGVADDTVVAAGPYEGMKFFEIGQQLFRSGDPGRGVPACMACHGPTGAGNPGPPYPHVAGQSSWYSARRLQEYRDGTTGESDTRLFDIMHEVAQRLTDEEIQALSSYMEGLHPRPDAAMRAAMARIETGPAPIAAPAAGDPGEADIGTQDGGTVAIEQQGQAADGDAPETGSDPAGPRSEDAQAEPDADAEGATGDPSRQ